jgi:hypothetical protein
MPYTVHYYYYIHCFNEWLQKETLPGPCWHHGPINCAYILYIFSYLIAAAASWLLLPIEYMIGFGVPESGNTNSLASHVVGPAVYMEGKLSWRMHPQSKSWLGDEDDE